MDDGDERPSFHPAIAGRERPMADLADAVRRLVTLVVTNTAPAGVLDSVVAKLGEAADVLAVHVPPEPPPRFFDPRTVSSTPATARRFDDQTAMADMAMRGAMPYDLVVGRYNPLALPVVIAWEPPLAVGRATFTTAYEGGPGWVHGAAIAGAFDIVLTAANQLAGAAGPTVWLSVRFRRPTLVGVDARFEAEVVENDGRRVRSRGRLIQDGLVCVEAEGEFATLDVGGLSRASARPRTMGDGPHEPRTTD